MVNNLAISVKCHFTEFHPMNWTIGKHLFRSILKYLYAVQSTQFPSEMLHWFSLRQVYMTSASNREQCVLPFQLEISFTFCTLSHKIPLLPKKRKKEKKRKHYLNIVAVSKCTPSTNFCNS